MPVTIPAPPEPNQGGDASGREVSLINRFDYYKVPLKYGRPTGKDTDYDYFADASVSTGRFAISKKYNNALPDTHVTYDELEDSDGEKGVINTRTLEGSIFFMGGRFNNYARKCRTESFLADLQHLEQLELSDELREQYKLERPRIRGVWMLPIKPSTYGNDPDIATYYEPHGKSKLEMELPNGETYKAGDEIPCSDCGLCFVKQHDEELAKSKGRAEYILSVLVSKVGNTKLEFPFPLKINLTSTAFSSIYNLIYEVSQYDPTREIVESVIKFELRPLMNRSGEAVPNCYEIFGTVVGDTDAKALNVINSVVSLNSYKPKNDNGANKTNNNNSASKSNAKKGAKKSTQQTDEYDF